MNQRWSLRGHPWPRGGARGHILMYLALALKIKSLALASKPQVLVNCPVLGSRTALFFELLQFCRSVKKIVEDLFFGDRLKRFFEDLFVLENTGARVLGLGLEHSCPWPRKNLSSEGLKPTWPRP